MNIFTNTYESPCRVPELRTERPMGFSRTDQSAQRPRSLQKPFSKWKMRSRLHNTWLGQEGTGLGLWRSPYLWEVMERLLSRPLRYLVFLSSMPLPSSLFHALPIPSLHTPLPGLEHKASHFEIRQQKQAQICFVP